jgi:hypothetical protein
LVTLLLTPLAAVLAGEVPPGNPWRPPGPGDQVATYRGTRANVPPILPVYRGSSDAGRASAPIGPAEGETSPEVLAAGSRLWIVDRDEGTLTACRLGPTAYVGRDRVRCTRRGLP